MNNRREHALILAMQHQLAAPQFKIDIRKRLPNSWDHQMTIFVRLISGRYHRVDKFQLDPNDMMRFGASESGYYLLYELSGQTIVDLGSGVSKVPVADWIEFFNTLSDCVSENKHMFWTDALDDIRRWIDDLRKKQ